ncbi:JAB domain-containing protein [Desulfobaculum bizertense]|uniref:JAB domain-containing protein n=1 Tax=Desulfobaculum bizertense TaxID=376490 RepID=UPI00254627DB|nr:JAB domain-containing protein [Desulfobaculum bizertense]
MHLKEVYRTAVMRDAHAIVLAHNHPSGQCLPSKEDKSCTAKLKSAGMLLGIELLDHVIVTKEGHYSFTERDDL